VFLCIFVVLDSELIVTFLLASFSFFIANIIAVSVVDFRCLFVAIAETICLSFRSVKLLVLSVSLPLFTDCVSPVYLFQVQLATDRVMLDISDVGNASLNTFNSRAFETSAATKLA